MIWAWCVKESEPRRWVQEASSGSKPDPDGRSGPGAKQNRSRFIRLASGCEASHDLVDAVRVVHRLTVYLACVFRKTLPKCRDRYAPIVKAPATSARQVGFGPITTG